MNIPASLLRTLVHLVAIALLTVPEVAAQIPDQCLEIESILVDACNPSDQCPGSTEGQNEMVRFKTGPVAIALNELEADWPNNPWRGLAQNANTASITAQLNATIENCGFLIEPPNGIIPPGSTVLMVTSPEMCLAGNSFTALADTLYLIFQVTGNTQGHFANSPASGQAISPTPPAGNSERTLVLTYLPTGCSDEVTYIRELLVNNQGTYGGQSGESDGSTVVFSWPGVPVATYVNYGCQAPFEPLLVQAEVEGSLCGGAGTVTLTGAVVGGGFSSVLWTGGTGTFADPTALGTTYTAGSGDNDAVILQLCVQTDCADPICTLVTVPAGDGPSVSITADGPLTLCPGDQLVLSASGADSYVWSTSATTSNITITEPGTYLVTGTNACGTGSAEVTVLAGTGILVEIIGDTEICPGESTVLTATGATSYVWNTQATTASITVTSPGTYSVTGTNACGTATDLVTVTEAPGPTVMISGSTEICQGGSTTLTASGADSYTWSTTESTASITVSTAGVYTVTGTNACGAATISAEVLELDLPSVVITGDTIICQGSSTVLTASGTGPFTWSNGQSGASITVSQPGTYVATASNSCGSASTGVTVAMVMISSSFAAQPNSGSAPLNVQFSNGSTPADATFVWDFADGGGSDVPDPIHLFTEPGTYIVELLVSSNGCTAVSTSTVVVTVPVEIPESSLFVPNVFTPNGDQMNDVYALTAVNIASLNMRIFNRWGQLVNELDRVGEVWDGRSLSGSLVPDGTYFYTIEAKGLDGRSYDLKGHVTVLR
ncbi:MAG: gliding motility-associated C-terminal domain-containing protein [Flavobacteriales bacterium]|nr:gliding motility-associated C-terminal domain-containing protein [Flavobacteriales bacterium]